MIRYRNVLFVVLGFLISCLFLLIPISIPKVERTLSWSHSSLPTTSKGTSELSNVFCREEIVMTASNVSFWLVEKIETGRYFISSSISQVSAEYKECFSNALFSARLLSPSSSKPNTIVTLDPPQFSSKLDLYELSIQPRLESIPAGNYTLEIRLEWSRLIGGNEGIVCGNQNWTCDPLKMIESVGRNVSFIGIPLKLEMDDQTVEITKSQSKKINLLIEAIITNSMIHLDNFPIVTPSLCRNLTKLAGFWFNEQFFPTPSSKICSLTSFTLPPSFAPNEHTIIWIHLIGDSNLRNLYSHLSNSFGRGISAHNFVESSSIRNGNLQYISLRSFTGEYSRDSKYLPDVIISWNWFYQTSSNFESNAEELKLFTSETLEDFLRRSNMLKILGRTDPNSSLPDIASSMRPKRLYISPGSHSEQLTSLGSSASLDVLLSSKGIGSILLNDPTLIKFFTTTLVNSGFIPLNKFPHQDLVRNNFIIRAKNRILSDRPELVGKVIDVGDMTSGITENYMKNEGKLDAVHFIGAVYDEWSKLVWADLGS